MLTLQIPAFRCASFPLILVSMFLCACSSIPAENTIPPSRHLVMGCKILDTNGVVLRSYPAQQCLFFSDGRYAQRTQKSLKLMSPASEKIWTLSMHTHHTLATTESGKLLVASSEIQNFGGQPSRFDVLHVVSQQGKIEHSFRFFEHWKEFELAAPAGSLRPRPFKWDRSAFPDVETEYSHVNSFYEIPENPNSVPIKAFEKGNFVVNLGNPGVVLILDPQLSKILWAKAAADVSSPPSPSLHDVQILRNGHLLLFANEVRRPGQPEKLMSALEEFDPLSGKSIWSYPISSDVGSYTEFGGSIQILDDDRVLFSENSKGGQAVEINRQGREFYRVPHPEIDQKIGLPFRIQEVKKFDLSNFLRLNSGI